MSDLNFRRDQTISIFKFLFINIKTSWTLSPIIAAAMVDREMQILKCFENKKSFLEERKIILIFFSGLSIMKELRT